ncbi:MAG TPA: hypothetical protein VID69_04535 [Actinomycetota bacterium]|jgi:hypothetical protein
MTNADDIKDLALSFARADADREEAVRELETRCGGRRVAAVRARQHLAEELEADAGRVEIERAISLLDDLLGRLPV